jgi:hypothetical protein
MPPAPLWVCYICSPETEILWLSDKVIRNDKNYLNQKITGSFSSQGNLKQKKTKKTEQAIPILLSLKQLSGEK